MKNFIKNKGFTFIEVIIAIVIIAVIAICIGSTIPQAFNTTRETSDLEKATLLSAKYIETLKAELSFRSVYDNIAEGNELPIEASSEYTHNNYFTVIGTTTNLEAETINGVSVATLKSIDINYTRTSDGKNMTSLSFVMARPNL